MMPVRVIPPAASSPKRPFFAIQARGFLSLLVLLVFLLAPASVFSAPETTRDFMTGVTAYQSGDYPAAIAAFQCVVDAGVQSGPLYYNLGNAHMKNGDLGQAIWWYERASLRMPHDPDLKFNLDYAHTRIRDEASKPGLSLQRVLFFWKYALTPDSVRWVAIASFWLFWVLLAFRVWRGRRSPAAAGLVCLVIALVFTVTAVVNYAEDRYRKSGVILPSEVSVRSGLSETDTELFPLHAGTLVRIEEERGEHVKIRFSDEKIGWLPATVVGIISL